MLKMEKLKGKRQSAANRTLYENEMYARIGTFYVYVAQFGYVNFLSNFNETKLETELDFGCFFSAGAPLICQSGLWHDFLCAVFRHPYVAWLLFSSCDKGRHNN